MVRESQKKSNVQKPPEAINFKTSVDLDKGAFTDIIHQKGYTAFLDRGLKCPCIDLDASSPEPSCRNCGGSGWIFSNRQEDKVILTSLNRQTQYKNWNEELIGTASVTVDDNFRLSFMDRITLVHARVLHKQNLRVKRTLDNLGTPQIFSFATHPIIEVYSLIQYLDPNQKVIPIDKSLYSIEDQVIKLDQSLENSKLSICYLHRPSYYVIDIGREEILTNIDNKPIRLPTMGTARRSQYVLDSESYSGNLLFENFNL